MFRHASRGGGGGSSSHHHIKVTCLFLKLTANQLLVFYWIYDSSQVNLLTSAVLFKRYNFINFMSFEIVETISEVQII